MFEQVVLDGVVDPLQRERLSGQEGRARVLAAAALSASERVQTFLPRQIAGGSRADRQRVGIDIVGAEGLEVDARNTVGGHVAPQVESRQRSDDVEMLAHWKDREEGEHRRHLHPVERLVSPVQCSGSEAGQRVRERTADPRPALFVRDRRNRTRPLREAERVETEIRQHDQCDQRQDHHGFAIGFEPRRPAHEATPEAVADGDQHRQFDEILERRVQPPRSTGNGRQR